MAKILLQLGETFKKNGIEFELVTIMGRDDPDNPGEQIDIAYEFISKADADANRKRNEESVKHERKLAKEREDKRQRLLELGTPQESVDTMNDQQLDAALARFTATKPLNDPRA